jgi:class 3 adenylate cyclase
MAPAAGYALMVLKGPDQPRLFVLTRFPARIGLEEDAHARLSDPAVAESRCEIHERDGRLWLVVVRADIPVTVDGQPVAQGTQAPLAANRSTIVLGDTTLALHDVSALLAKMELRPTADEPQPSAAPVTDPVPSARPVDAEKAGSAVGDLTISGLVPPTIMFKSETQALMMADVCDSTGQAYSVAKVQGSDTANKLLGKAFQAFYALFDRHAQARRVLHVLKPGDAVFATFRSPEDCLAVCCKILSDLEQLRPKLQEKGLMPLNVRVAAHYAPVLHSADQSQFFGLPIHLTNRLQGLTSEQAVGSLTGDFPKVNRIFLTAEIFDALPDAWKPLAWRVGSFSVKGFAEEAFPVYGLRWQDVIGRKLVE